MGVIHSLRSLRCNDRSIFFSFILKFFAKIDKTRLKFQLLIYDDLDIDKLITFWTRYLLVKNTQFFKTTILKRRGSGTYLKKMQYGVIMVHFGNMKLRNLIISQIANIENL